MKMRFPYLKRRRRHQRKDQRVNLRLMLLQYHKRQDQPHQNRVGLPHQEQLCKPSHSCQMRRRIHPLLQEACPQYLQDLKLQEAFPAVGTVVYSTNYLTDRRYLPQG